MRIYNKIVYDIETWKVLDEEFFEYEGEVAECGASLVFFIVSIVISLVTAYLSYKAMDMPEIQSETGGVKVNTKSTKEPLRIVYGRQKVGGNDVWGRTGKAHNKKLLISTTVSEGEVQGIYQENGEDQIFIDDKIYTEYGNKVNYTFYPGASAQDVHSFFTSAYGEHQYNEPMHYTAYIAYNLTWDENKFRGIPKREVIIDGLLLHDTRTPSAAPAWNDNPALVLYDFMTNARYGIGSCQKYN